MLWQFARDHSAADCRSFLENYVVGGKDEGLTESCVREACGLKVKKQTEDPQALQLRTHSTEHAEEYQPSSAGGLCKSCKVGFAETER